MAWAGTGLVWAVSGGVLSSRTIAYAAEAPAADFTFAQISDTHIGFKGGGFLQFLRAITRARFTTATDRPHSATALRLDDRRPTAAHAADDQPIDRPRPTDRVPRRCVLRIGRLPTDPPLQRVSIRKAGHLLTAIAPSRIERSSCRSKVRDLAHGPDPERLESGDELSAERRRFVVDPDRHLDRHGTPYEAGAFQTTKHRGQRLLAHAFHALEQARKPKWSVRLQLAQGPQTPFVGHPREDLADHPFLIVVQSFTDLCGLESLP